MGDQNQTSLLDMPSISSSSNAQYLTPQMAQQLANIAYAPDEQNGLQQQLQQAIALRNGEMPQRHTPIAAALDGVGNIAKRIQSFQQENRIRGQQADLLRNNKDTWAQYHLGLSDEAARQIAQAKALRNGTYQPAAGQGEAAPPQMDLSQT